MPIGNYELRVEKAGFTAYVQSGIHLTVDLAATQNVTLQVGAVTEATSIVSLPGPPSMIRRRLTTPTVVTVSFPPEACLVVGAGPAPEVDVVAEA